jgi:hypothetical protein
MTVEQKLKDAGSSEVLRFGGAGTVLLLSLLAFVGLHPLMLGGTAARLVGGTILVMILVAGTMAASRSTTQRAISAVLAVSAFGLHSVSLMSRNTVVEAIAMVVFSAFCLYTALVMLRRVLSFGRLYADRVHAALSVYILLAMFWAAGYALIELVSPGAFSFPSGSVETLEPRRTIHLLPHTFHLSVATLTSTGYGDITPIAPFARSLAQLEQLTGIFYIAVLISRLVGLYPDSDKTGA